MVALGDAEEALDDGPGGVAEAEPDEVSDPGERRLLAVEGDDRTGAEHRHDEADERLAPVGTIGPDDPERQAEQAAGEPQQRIGERQVVAVGGREQEEDRQARGPVEQDVDLVAEDPPFARRERPGRVRVGGRPGCQQGRVEGDIAAADQARADRSPDQRQLQQPAGTVAELEIWPFLATRVMTQTTGPHKQPQFGRSKGHPSCLWLPRRDGE